MQAASTTAGRGHQRPRCSWALHNRSLSGLAAQVWRSPCQRPQSAERGPVEPPCPLQVHPQARGAAAGVGHLSSPALVSPPTRAGVDAEQPHLLPGACCSALLQQGLIPTADARRLQGWPASVAALPSLTALLASLVLSCWCLACWLHRRHARRKRGQRQQREPCQRCQQGQCCQRRQACASCRPQTGAWSGTTRCQRTTPWQPRLRQTSPLRQPATQQKRTACARAGWLPATCRGQPPCCSQILPGMPGFAVPVGTSGLAVFDSCCVMHRALKAHDGRMAVCEAQPSKAGPLKLVREQSSGARALPSGMRFAGPGASSPCRRFCLLKAQRMGAAQCEAKWAPLGGLQLQMQPGRVGLTQPMCRNTDLLVWSVVASRPLATRCSGTSSQLNPDIQPDLLELDSDDFEGRCQACDVVTCAWLPDFTQSSPTCRRSGAACARCATRRPAQEAWLVHQPLQAQPMPSPGQALQLMASRLRAGGLQPLGQVHLPASTRICRCARQHKIRPGLPGLTSCAAPPAPSCRCGPGSCPSRSAQQLPVTLTGQQRAGCRLARLHVHCLSLPCRCIPPTRAECLQATRAGGLPA